MSDATDQPDGRDAIQRAEDVRPRPQVAPPPLREAIQPPIAAKPKAPVRGERDAADEAIHVGKVASQEILAPRRVNRDLIGQTLRERRGFMFGAAIWTLLGMVLVCIAAIIANVHVALAAVGPVAVALMLVLLRRRPFVCHVELDGLVFDRLKLTLPLVAIEEVIAGGAKKEAFLICHADGFISVPSALSIPWQAFREYLKDNLQPQLFTPRLPARLQKYFDRNVALFGVGAMHVFWARDHLRPARPPGRTGLAVCMGLVVASVLWYTVGINQGRDFRPWLGAGAGVGILSFLIGLLFYLRAFPRTPRLKNWQRSALVLGPGGMALEQGELVGELRWEEVRKIANRTRGASFTLDSGGTQPCVRLDVTGASIMVLDVYHRPLFFIHDLIESLYCEADR